MYLKPSHHVFKLETAVGKKCKTGAFSSKANTLSFANAETGGLEGTTFTAGIKRIQENNLQSFPY